jgi:hypothetical protein
MTVPQEVKLARHAGDLDDDGHEIVETGITAETDATLVLAPDGAGGVEFRAETGGAGATFATPAIVLGTVAAAGAATTVIRSDSTIVAFDATMPTTSVPTDAAATGSAAKAARRDHVHGREPLSNVIPLVEAGSGAPGTSVLWSRDDHVHPSAPAGGAVWAPVMVTDPTIVTTDGHTVYMVLTLVDGSPVVVST